MGVLVSANALNKEVLSGDTFYSCFYSSDPAAGAGFCCLAFFSFLGLGASSSSSSAAKAAYFFALAASLAAAFAAFTASL